MAVTDPLAAGPPIRVLHLREWGWVGVGGYVACRPGDACLLGHKQGWGERGGVGFRTPCLVRVIRGEGQEGRGVPFAPQSAPVCAPQRDGANPTRRGRGKLPSTCQAGWHQEGVRPGHAASGVGVGEHIHLMPPYHFAHPSSYAFAGGGCQEQMEERGGGRMRVFEGDS